MTTWQAFLLGVMAALTPGLIFLAWMMRSPMMLEDTSEDTSIVPPQSEHAAGWPR
jgi:hypothetical protein